MLKIKDNVLNSSPKTACKIGCLPRKTHKANFFLPAGIKNLRNDLQEGTRRHIEAYLDVSLEKKKGTEEHEFVFSSATLEVKLYLSLSIIAAVLTLGIGKITKEK